MKTLKLRLFIMLPLFAFIGMLTLFGGESTITVDPVVQSTQRETTVAPIPKRVAPTISDSGRILQNAYDRRQSMLQVRGKATVYRILADDNDGSRHQKFLLRTGTGQSVLLAHNIDLEPRIGCIQVGDIVEFYGVYEYNAKGGVVHCTHHDPDGRHIGGWLKHKGRTYQ